MSTKTNIFLFLFFYAFVFSQTLNQIKTIVIDPGHGGKDPGCNGIFAKEKDVSLAVSLKLKNYIEKYLPDVTVIMTREKDEFVELEERAQIANRNKADLFISIHCNAAGKPVMVKDPKTKKMKVKMRKNARGKLVPVETINPEPYGTETYVMGIKNEEGKMQVAMRENAAIYLEDDYEKKYGGFDPDSEESYIIMSNYTSALVIKSAMLAMKMQEDYKRFAGRIDKGVHRQSIWVLWRTSMPSVLTEIGYLTNPLEEKFLASDEGQEYLAKCMARAIRRFKCENEGRKYQFDDELEKMTPLENENLLAIKSGSKKLTDSLSTLIKNDANKEPDNEHTLLKDESGSVKETTYNDSGTVNPEGQTIPDNTKQGIICDSISDTLPMYKIQFATSPTLLDLSKYSDKGLICPHFYVQNNLYKYVSGNFTKMKEAAIHQKELMDKGFKDCFVIAWYKGKRISIEEAKQLHRYTGN
ncbi:MAG: N-acetylmuramoyl-L-alanine amidase [Bacteroidia bacterium]|nr:N-acetylmuramoyl-L-alanine amidase [Bacteroidia bacterium]